jgi:protein-disulfide isomerase
VIHRFLRPPPARKMFVRSGINCYSKPYGVAFFDWIRNELGIECMVRTVKLTMLLAVCLTVWPAPTQSLDPASGKILGGSLKSPIKVEVFSDFQCPACRELYLYTIKPVLQDYSSKDKVCIIYHEFPLQMHAYAREAARYSEAASRLGQQKLLAVFSVLYTDQAEWGQNGNLEASIAKVLSHEEIQALKKSMQNTSIDAAIEKELQLGKTKEIRSTPTMIISYSGKQQTVTNAVNYVTLKQFFDQILK